MSGVSVGPGATQYTFAQGLNAFSNMIFERTKTGKAARTAAQAAGFTDDTPLLAGGVLGRLSTMGRSYQASIRSAKASSAKAARIAAGKRNLRFDPRTISRNRALRSTKNTQLGISRSLTVLGQHPVPGSTMNQRIAATSAGILTKRYMEDVATILDEDLIKKGITPKNYTGKSADSLARYREMFEKASGGPSQYVDDALDTIDSKVVRQMAGKAFSAGEYKVAARLGGRALGAAYAKVSGPLNIVGTASLVYDLGKMAAVGVVSAGNFAKEAAKSMQGSMRKPLFGMGYQDNEVAATSRSRGVMAIQNSRLNARSMLGSEAGMMAAHFG